MRRVSVSTVVILASARRRMLREAQRAYPHETGGVLIGRFDKQGPHIAKAGDAGPAASAGATRFVRDGAHAQALVDETVARSGGRLDYIGEWHSHPNDQGASPTDVNSMSQLSRDRAYRRSQPVLIIVRRRGRSWLIEAHQLRGQKLVRLTEISPRVRT